MSEKTNREIGGEQEKVESNGEMGDDVQGPRPRD
jgi:hypothetical protein